MAHWAEIDENNLVIQVLVLDDSKSSDWLVERFGGTWIQTSYSGSIRKNYAGIGHTYDSELDAFIPPKPFESWILNEETAQWEAPTPKPEGNYYWDEDSTSWVEVTEEEN
jgi:hypothetical protein